LLFIRKAAAELLRMALKPIERCLDVVRGVLNDHASSMRVIRHRICSGMYLNGFLTKPEDVH
jgi:hypothetical protein